MVAEHQGWEQDEESQDQLQQPDTGGGWKPWMWSIPLLILIGLAGWWYVGREPEPAPAPPSVTAPVPEETAKPVAAPTSGEPALTEEQASFLQYFTVSVLENVLTEQGGSWDLRAFRRMVQTAINGEFLMEAAGMSWDRWEKERGHIVQQARRVLSDPTFLTFVWQRFREPVLAAVRASGKGQSVRAWTVRALPYFSGALPRGRSRLLSAYYEIDRALDQEMKKAVFDEDRIRKLTVELDRRYQAVTRAGMDQDDIYLFEFSRRRMQEGGRDLLKAYAAILEDINQSVQ